MRIQDEAELAEILKREGMQEANPGLVAGSSNDGRTAGNVRFDLENAGSSPAPATKYHSRPTVYNGIRYHSQKEARFAAELDLRQKAGEISFWLRQIPFALPGGSRYLLDFLVFACLPESPPCPKGCFDYVDFVETKGKDLPLGKLKRRQVEELYGIKITVI